MINTETNASSHLQIFQQLKNDGKYHNNKHTIQWDRKLSNKYVLFCGPQTGNVTQVATTAKLVSCLGAMVAYYTVLSYDRGMFCLTASQIHKLCQ